MFSLMPSSRGSLDDDATVESGVGLVVIAWRCRLLCEANTAEWLAANWTCFRATHTSGLVHHGKLLMITSPLGHKRTSQCILVMSALPPKADIGPRNL